MEIDFSVSELEVLSAALTRLKFEDPPSEPFFGSHYFAAAHDRILRSIITASREKGDLGRAARWEKWRDWQGREYERTLIFHYATALTAWPTWSDEEKVEFLRVCAAPFTPGEADLNSLREEIDSSPQARTEGEPNQ
ncbi:hypothetical protein DTL70_20865 [Streptomyces diacarni]|uniref:Uncharacterized protein n=1 Tax=Streptomyces diacarni TaxID=2800381 RepID=A0A367ERZ5_9ACTN|nr:hypothetical protein [Streptomyces diacarni]RCG20733.1 hypothetical protein DTL70_20865 [Streptomyces diacarni]